MDIVGSGLVSCEPYHADLPDSSLWGPRKKLAFINQTNVSAAQHLVGYGCGNHAREQISLVMQDIDRDRKSSILRWPSQTYRACSWATSVIKNNERTNLFGHGTNDCLEASRTGLQAFTSMVCQRSECAAISFHTRLESSRPQHRWRQISFNGKLIGGRCLYLPRMWRRILVPSQESTLLLSRSRISSTE